MGNTQKSLADGSIYGQAILQSKSGLGGAGLNQGATSLPLKGWPLTGMDNLRPNMGLQAQKPNMQNQNPFYLASQQQQLAHAPNYGLVGLPRGNLSIKDGQSQTTRNDGSMKMPQVQVQQSNSQQEDQLQQQSNRKRKQHSSSGPANSTGTGNTVGPSPSSPASTHTPGDGITTATSIQHVNNNNALKSMMIYGSEATGGITSSTNHLDDIEHFGDDNVESFLQDDGGDGREVYGTLKQTLTEHKKDSSKGFSFAEVGCIQTTNKVLCCHFSSDGKFLASAGHDTKAVLWNMDTLQTESIPEEHQTLITDVRFRSNSTQFGTASFDKSLRIWDAANPSYCQHAYTRHTSHIMSLDFHPKKNNLFCFCDSNDRIHYWNLNPFQCARVSQGGSGQVRFQPASGKLLATASNKAVSIFDVETDRKTHLFQAHAELVTYLCWDLNGEYLASVSSDSVRVWSVASGDCIHELNTSGGVRFYSCAFHPTYSALLVIGGKQSLELWNLAENKTMSVPAHDNIVAALAQSPVTGMVASASHDNSVKLWK